jgi:hypothetical protein
LNGRTDEAIAILAASPPTFIPRVSLANLYTSLGRYSEAADALREVPSGLFTPGALEEAIRLLRAAPAKVTSPQSIVSAGALGFVYLSAGIPVRVLDFYERSVEAGVPAVGSNAGNLWAAAYAPVRKTERFKAYVREAGMVEYWHTNGWPPLPSHYR